MIAFLDGPELIVLLVALVTIPLHFLPTIIAVRRKSPKITSVVLVNILLGWTVVGWVAALIIALNGAREPATPLQRNRP